MELVIVESPAKSKTIEKYLGKEYKVVASVGHIRDLSTKGKFGLGVDIENNFKPDYIPNPDKKDVIKNLKNLTKSADHVYLATDPDREGEAISWHLYDTLKLKDKDYDRVLFYEITKDKVLEGLSNPRKIDTNLVHSQETRRILDRIIGFRLSKLMQNKIGGKSAGRVQSVALKLIVDREREIEAFVAEPYYSIKATFDEFESELFSYNNDGKKLDLKDKIETENILNSLGHDFKVINSEKKSKNRSSKLPFTTSTLQQEASNKLGFAAKKTMQIAQKLYEGIDLGNEHTGLITYMRTDSIRLSEEFTGPTFKFIEENLGKEYVGKVKETKKKDNVQDGHEGIRPTSIFRTPKSLIGKIDQDSLKLYELIYYRTMASLMSDAKTDETTIMLDNNNYQFKSTGTVITFDGYLKVYSKFEDANDKILPNLNIGEVLTTDKIEMEEHTTKPKSRYTEAKLIKELEEKGIGRPSTYATILTNIRERDYVVMDDKKFKPTEMGKLVTDGLQEYFSNIINVSYTANMEKDLDEIAEGNEQELDILTEFYKLFEETLNKAYQGMKRKEAVETGEECPICHSPLVERDSKNGKFIGCSNYPDCTYIKPQEQELELIDEDCPECGNKLSKRHGKFGEFIACSKYPECHYIKKESNDLEELEEVCPNCNNHLVKRKGRYGEFICCKNYPTCNYVKKENNNILEELEEVCPNCNNHLVKRKGRYGEFICCKNYPTCHYIKKENQKEVVEIMTCPKCGGKIVEKPTRTGKVFYGCNNYPKCKVALWDKPNGKLCSKCSGIVVEKNGIFECNDCGYKED